MSRGEREVRTGAADGAAAAGVPGEAAGVRPGTHPFLALLKIQLLMSIRGIGLRLTRGRSRWALLLIPVALVGFAPLIAMLGAVDIAFYRAGAALGVGYAVLVFAFAIGQLTAFSFGILYVLSTFYFARDLRLLVPMPLRARDIVLSKFLTVVGGELLTMAPIVLPALVVYGAEAHVGLLYWPFAVVIYLLLAVPALVLASLFSFVVMRFTQGRANRDVIRVLASLLGIGFALSIQFLNRFNGVNRHGPTDISAAQQAADQFLRGSGSAFIHALGRYAPTSIWAADALREGAPAFGLGGFALYLGVSVLALALLVWFAEKLFFAGLAGIDEVRTGRRTLSEAELREATSRARPPIAALLQREVWLLNRNPSFLINAILPPILVPVFMFIALSQNPDTHLAAGGLATYASSPLVPLMAMAAVIFAGAMSSVTASGISREGRQFWVSRVIPVAPRLQMAAKLLHSLLFVALDLLVVLAVAAFLGVLTPVAVIYTLLGALLGGVASSAGSLMIDLLNPHLKWTDPAQAMKGNMNVLFGMLLTVLILGLGAAGAGIGWLINPVVAAPAALLVLAILGVGLTVGGAALADYRYPRIEE